MKRGWEKKQLGELAELRGRIGWRGLTAKEYTKEGPLFLSVHSLNYGDYVDFRDAFHISEERYAESPEIMLQSGDVLICKDGAGIGKVGIVGDLPGRASINSSLLLIRSGKNILPKFLYRCLSSPYFQEIVQSRLNGATTPHLYQRDITEFPVVLPSLADQQRIMDMLDEAFADLATAQANAEKNLQNARALFESHLQSVFTHRGQGWVDAKLADVLAILRNGMNCKQDKSGVGSKISRIESIWNARFDITRVGYAAIPETQKDKFLLKKGDVLFSHINSAIHVGKTALFDIEEEVVHGVNLLLMRTKSSVLPAYLDLYLKHIFSAGYWLRVCKQSINQASVNQQDINRVPFRYPSLERQREIVEQMDALSAETQRLARIYAQKQAALAELKKSLLHQAFSGNL